MPTPITVSFLTADGQISLPLDTGTVIIIAGPNGTGKSALLVELYRMLGEETATYLPGHRQIHFNGDWDATSRGIEQLYRQLFINHGHFNRYKNTWAEDQFKSEIRMLQNKAAEYDRAFRTRLQDRKSFAEPLDSYKDSPVDKVNEIFSQARLPVRFVPTDKGLSVQRGSVPLYSIERLSDGERAALFVASSFVNRQPGTVLLIDEPEKHLDQSIASLFVETCIRMRTDIAVILSTHDPRLVERLSDKSLLHIRNSEIVSEEPERRRYSVSPVSNQGQGLDEIKKDLLGVRGKVLFIEGESSSLDIPLYSQVYSGVRVISKGSFQEVCDATKGIGRLVDGHWLEPRGLIDGDGRDGEEISNLLSDGIHVLPYPTIENLFFIEQAIGCFVEADMHYRGGDTQEERMSKFGAEVVAAAKADRENIISQRVSWRITRALSDKKVSPRKVMEGFRDDLVVGISEIYEEVSVQVDEVIGLNDPMKIMRSLPIKKTTVPGRAAKALGAKNFDHYTKVILRRIELAEPAGVVLISSLRALLPKAFGHEGPKIPQ